MVQREYGRLRAIRPPLPLTWAVIAVSLAIRGILLPLTNGPDFVVWDLASRATLAGTNIYANHPAGYPGGPYTYPPLFLYIELPFQWIAQLSGLPFRVLGKLPIVAGDVLTAGFLAAFLRRRCHGDRAIATACALFLLNPLVLYNGAFYGRFDTLCVGLFLAGLHFHAANGPTSWSFLGAYAAAIATKIYPVFLLPWLWTRQPAARGPLLAALILVVGGVSLPYFVTSPVAYVSDILFYNLGRAPTNLSWQIVLLDLSPQAVRAAGVILLGVFAVLLTRLSEFDAYGAALLGVLLFFLCSKLVIEQYFLWAVPFLILNAIDGQSRSDFALLLVLSTVGMLSNHYIHPFGERAVGLNVAAAAAIAAYVARAFGRASACAGDDSREPVAAL